MGNLGNGLILAAMIAVLVFSSLSTNASAQISPSPTPTSIPAPTASSSPTVSTPTPPSTPTHPTPTVTCPKPTVPEYNLRVSPSNNGIIILTIKNQVFTPVNDPNGIHIYMVYNVRASTNNGNWTELYKTEDGYPQPSNSDFTVFLYAMENSSYNPGSVTLNGRLIGVFPVYGQIDFQVEAMIGYRTRSISPVLLMPYIFAGEKSGWSNTQTINIIDGSNSPSPTPFLPPRNPPRLDPLYCLIPASVILAVVILSALLFRRYRKKF